MYYLAPANLFTTQSFPVLFTDTHLIQVMRSAVAFYCFFSLSSASDRACDEDEHSLLQARSHPRPPAATGVAGPAILLESVKTLARHMKGESPDIVAAAAESVQSAVESMIPLLQDEHADAQGLLDRQFEEIQSCFSALHGTAVRDDYADKLFVMNQCTDDQNAAAEAQQKVCDVWHGHASRLELPCTSLSPSTPPEEVYEASARLRDWVQDVWPIIESQRNECNDATARAAAEERRCSPVIADYDETFCQHQHSCSLLVACYNHEKERYQEMISDSNAGVSARQQQFQTNTQVQCILGLVTDAIGTNAVIDDLGSCDGDADVDHLTLSFKDAEAPTICPPQQIGDPQCLAVDLPLSWEGGVPTETTPTLPTFPTTGICEDAGWSYVLNYHDDRSLDDIPNTWSDVDPGFRNSNAHYIGREEIQQTEFGEVELCAGSAQSCQKTCYPLLLDDIACTCSGLDGFAGIIHQLAGACQPSDCSGREVIRSNPANRMVDFTCPGAPVIPAWYGPRGSCDSCLVFGPGDSRRWAGLTLYAENNDFEFGVYRGAAARSTVHNCWHGLAAYEDDWDTFQVRVRPVQ